MSRTPIDFAHRTLRSRFEAWLLHSAAGRTHLHHGAAKERAIGRMGGTVVEIGPGPGINMRYYAPGVKVIAVEPNPVMHERLRAAATEHGVDLEVRTERGEAIGLPDACADAAVATLVLCGVDDPDGVLAEVRRILKPGGVFFFVEHVVAPEGSGTRRVQRLVKRPHRWMFNGCEVDRDTGGVLRSAGFGDVELEPVDLGRGGAYARHQIVGTATA